MKCFKLACVVSKWMCVSCLPCSCSCKRFLGCLWEDCSLNLSRCVSKLSEMGPGSRFRRLIPERDQKIADNPEKASEGPPGINITRLYWGNEGELGSRLVGGGKAEGAWAAMNCHELSSFTVGKHQMKFFLDVIVMQLIASVQSSRWPGSCFAVASCTMS